ncbi:hypothetical protein ACFV6F_18025, partial [Kitasatospora phosalacinea]|uniref:hypothetical protein n=1 Tax=Kitasatospora phosalacinea TaxID=2065 RepID=UPI00365388C0
MSTDDELTAALSRAFDGAAALAPDPVHERLAAGARRSGLRRQRRHVAAATGALAVAVLGAAAGFSAAGYGHSGADAPAASGHVQVSEQRFNELLTELLPKGTLQPMDRAWSGGRDPHRMGSVLAFDDGAGASTLQIDVQYTTDPVDQVTCVDGFDVPSDGCERTVQPDGSVLIVDKLRSANVPGLREWHGIWAAPDGRQVRLTEYNGGPSSPVRDAPPLTEAQLAALVGSPLWTEAFAALTPVSGAPSPGPSADARPSPLSAEDSATLLDELTPLLPAGTTVDVRDTAHTRLGLTVDGRHSSLMVAYEPPSQSGLDELAALPQSPPTPLEVREPLPGGGTVVVNAFGNGKTATDVLLRWVVTVHYPDGAKLLVNEWNGEQFHDAAPGTPALDLAALKAVALSPSWRSSCAPEGGGAG